MTSLRVHTSSNPMQQGGQILPQSKDDALFFRLRRERSTTSQGNRHGE